MAAMILAFVLMCLSAITAPGQSNINFSAAVCGPVMLDAKVGAVGDLDGDGDDDIVLLGDTITEIHLLFNHHPGAPTLSPPAATQGIPSDAAIADMDGDGDMDVLVVSTSGQLSSFINLWFKLGTSDD